MEEEKNSPSEKDEKNLSVENTATTTSTSNKKTSIKKESLDDLIRYAEEKFIPKKNFPKFNTGDTITVYYKIEDKTKDGKIKIRTQFFKGTVIQIRGKGATKTFTVRKISHNVGVERIFPINMPGLEKIEINSYGKVRRSRIFYFRNLTGKKARIKEDISRKSKKSEEIAAK